MAIKRFRIAEKYMREQDRRAFYEEMLRALWGYLGDKFNIPVADLTREVVREELSKRILELRDERNLRLKEIGKENSLVRQIIDLALLSNGMLKGKNLSDFIQRSISLIGAKE